MITLTAFLQWLVSSGGSVMAVSWLFERMAWFQALSSTAKENTVFGVASIIAIGAMAVILYAPAAVLATLAPFFLAVAGVFTTVFISKLYHNQDKK